MGMPAARNPEDPYEARSASSAFAQAAEGDEGPAEPPPEPALAPGLPSALPPAHPNASTVRSMIFDAKGPLLFAERAHATALRALSESAARRDGSAYIGSDDEEENLTMERDQSESARALLELRSNGNSISGLEFMRLSQLKRRAAQLGAHDDQIEACDDREDPVRAAIELVLHQSTRTSATKNAIPD